MMSPSFWQRKADCGAVFVEAVLSIPILIILGGAIIDYGLTIRDNAVIVSAARAGARAAAALPYSDKAFLKVVACQSARNYLVNSKLEISKFRVVVEPVDIEVAETGVATQAAIRVSVSHRDPPWYLYFRKTYVGSSSSLFLTESGVSVDSTHIC